MPREIVANPFKRPGVSCVICCHNSEKRLPKTLHYLSKQKVDPSIEWEVIIVNNGSTDFTPQVARQSWPSVLKISLSIVDESQLGLMHARRKGFEEALFDIVSFIDDDNWVCETWVQTIFHVMKRYPDIGACGGTNTVISETQLPWWFHKFQRSYAVGCQGETAGDITWKRGVLFGAGLTVRKYAWEDLISAGFQPLSVGRKGRLLTCGEDYEICLALRLRGWKIWYEPSLRLQHYMTSSRLRWSYLCKTLRLVGWSSPDLDPYYYASSKISSGKSLLLDVKMYWLIEIFRAIKGLIMILPTFIISILVSCEGNDKVLLKERLLGRISRLSSLRTEFDESCLCIMNSAWLCKKIKFEVEK